MSETIHSSKLLAQLWIENIIKRREQDTNDLFYTGIRELDDLIGGIAKGWYCIWGGEQKVGKTTFLLHLAEAHSLIGDLVIYFSREMTTLQLGDMVFAKASGINKMKFRKPDLTESDMVILKGAENKISKRSVYYVHGFTTVKQITTIIDNIAEIEERPVDAAIVDYLQLMNEPSEKHGRVREIESISRQFKTLTTDSKCSPLTIHAGSQINRKSIIEGITANSFRDSGSIEQDADLASIMSHRNDPLTQLPSLNSRYMNVVAARHCGLGKVPFFIDGGISKIGDLLSPQEVEAEEQYGLI